MRADVNGILLDLDDTLFDHRTASDRAVAQWAKSLAGWSGDDGQAQEIWTRLEEEHFPKYARGECTIVEQRRLRVRGFSAELAGVPDATADELMAGYLRFYETHWKPLPGAASLVERALDAGLRVGVLTNGEEDQQRAKLERIGLLRAELSVFTSAGLGVAKPSPRAFALACEGLGTLASRTLMVGDNHAVDILGARAAGLPTIHFDRWGLGLEADAATSLFEVESRVFAA